MVNLDLNNPREKIDGVERYPVNGALSAAYPGL